MKIGTPADHVLRMVGWEPDKATAPPKVIGVDEEGWVMQWYYPNRIVTLKRSGGVYRVAEVRRHADIT